MPDSGLRKQRVLFVVNGGHDWEAVISLLFGLDMFVIGYKLSHEESILLYIVANGMLSYRKESGRKRMIDRKYSRMRQVCD